MSTTSQSKPPLLAKLPPGRHTLPREFIEANQRTRLLAGLTVLLAREGAHAVTVAKITKESAVSRRTFYEQFSDKDEAVKVLLDLAFVQMFEAIDNAADAAPGAKKGTAAAAALLAFVHEHEDVARCMAVQGPVAHPEAYQAGLLHMQALVMPKRLGSLCGFDQSAYREFVVGGIAYVLRRALEEGEVDQLTEGEVLALATLA